MKKDFALNGMALNCSPRGNSAAIIYTDVLYDKKLSSIAKLIHCEITTYISHSIENYYPLSNKQIAETFGLSKTTVSAKISELIKAGYLKSETIQIKPFEDADYTIAERRLSW